jgi:Skp family chaperone for outer membrane proteins
VLKNAENRHIERQDLESEVEGTKRQCQIDLDAEFKARGEELDRLRAEFASQLSVAQEKAARQTRELAELYKKHAELQSEASTQRVEMQERSDAAIAAVPRV